MALVSNWPQLMLEKYEEGYSDIEVCRELRITKKQFQMYLDSSQPFRELVEYGHDLAEAWAYRQNRKAITSDTVSANNLKALEKRMENMYGWSTKVESKNANVNAEMDVAKLRAELETLLPDAMKAIGHERLALELQSTAKPIDYTDVAENDQEDER